MIDNEDELPSEGFTPDEENSKGASEFNPYGNPYGSFLADDSEEAKFQEPKEPDITEIKNRNSDKQNDIDFEEVPFPDFMAEEDNKQDTVSIAAFKNSLESNLHQDSEKKEFTPDSVDYGEMNKTALFIPPEEEKESETSDNSASVINPENVNNNESTHNTFDKEEEVKFQKKMTASDADKNPNSKPKVLNKRFILATIIILFGSVFVISFLMPAEKKSKTKNEKPKAEVHHSTDYSSLAKRQSSDSENIEPENTHYEDTNVSPTKDENVEIPPVIKKTDKEPYNPNTINYSSGTGNGTASSSTLQIPDTRNDSLHGKTISGIKGLSSTQQSYSTDYQQTIAKNTSQGSSTSNFSMPSKEEYMNNVLGAYSQAYGNATSQNNAYAVQNDQDGKNRFFNNGRNGENVGQGQFLNSNSLWQGTIFEAVLTSEMNTDLPGEITARIAKNIYSSQDGRFLLIPQNSVVYGTYNSSISYSQSRVQVAWHTLIRPDGYQIQLGNMNATDAKGASGLKGFVNDHPMAYLKAIGLMSVFSIVNTEFSKQLQNTNNSYVQDLLANSQNVTVELGDKLIDRAMNVQPTIRIKSGTKINIVVNQNLYLPPCEDIPVTQPYHKVR